MADKIECPKCHHSFIPTEEMSKKLRAEFEAKLESEREQMSQEVTAQVKKKLKETAERATEDARAEGKIELQILRDQISDTATKLREAQSKEIELRKQQRELEESKHGFELQMTRKMDEERGKIRAEAETRVAEDYSLKQQDWEKQRSDMAKQIEELRRKAEQGSQQTQGEVLELEIENTLKEAFIHDDVVPVAKGVRGGDIVQVVQTRVGLRAGAIIWELKRTKAWSDGWLTKIKDDQREAKADIAVIVSSVLPKGVSRIGQIDGVWVVDFQSFLGLATALRSSVLEVAQARQALVGKKDKMEHLYDYLSGQEFRGRIEGIVEAFSVMKEDLDSEKRAIEKIWAKREKQITKVVSTTSGMYGDLQGLIGASLPEIKALELQP